MDENMKKLVQQMIDISLFNANQLKTKKVGDTPTDGYQLTPQKYVDLYGTTADRPRGSVANFGQRYFSISVGYPFFFNPNSSVWVSATGSVVAGA